MLEGVKLTSIGVIGCYFGKMRPDFTMWLQSCKANPTIDFLVFTDQQWDKLPENVHFLHMSFSECKKLVQSKFDFQISLVTPYKLCDFKPAFGYIFSEYIKGYDFWGWCDFDMVFGDIRAFITEDVLSRYDKILQFGHLSLMRNTAQNNQVFELRGESLDYRIVFSQNKIFVFDEIIGIYSFYKHLGLPVYVSSRIVDVSTYIHSAFVRAWELDPYLPYRTVNRCLQTFLVENGKVFCVYWEHGQICYEEDIYLHMSSRKFMAIDATRYLITRRGFMDIGNREIDRKLIESVNRRLPTVLENIEYIWTRLSRALERRLKHSHSLLRPEHAISELG
ncbi:hypothetical protein IHQ76_08385 [Bifidobacterium dentium]|uniref:DUF6625 family protein n=1 Tax=Bifidobacterium TaxID=1678 RepID=UPI0010F79897|nr:MULTISPECIES: DUF6625 family protein [Bifidobacterium]MBF9696808.1 hypothetical protein [Bifidobacterium dentium]MBF9712968.1 hypothetical protein [Bifidobacterium dentium]MBF9714929.1 hypothetical protein [Bifidobacterium dentium]MBF9718906.1 hypothetical protein [Bifidobacterium dentium]